MGIARRLGLLIVCALAGIVAITAIVLGSERSLIMEERKTSLRQNVESAHSLIAHFHAQAKAKAGKMPEEQAQQMARDSLRAMRYSGNEYFWINDMRPVIMMHPIRPELDGKDLSDNKDPTGMRLFVEFVNVVKAREAGFVLYLWPKPGSTAPVLKASYVKGFAPWGWLVGSGVYVDAVDSAVNERIVKFGLSALVLAALLLGVSMLIFARPQARTAGQRGIGVLGHMGPRRVQQHRERAVRRLLQRRVVFGGVWLALGLAMLSLVAQIEREGRLFAVLWGAVFLGGVGRAL